MSLNVMLLVLFSALMHASWNAVVKSGKDKLVDTALLSAGAGVFAAVVLPFVPLPAPESRIFLAGSVVIHAVYFSLVALAYRAGDMSYAYPLMRGSAPLLTAVAAGVLLAEPLSAMGWLGVGILSAGILTLAGDSWRSGRFSRAQTAFGLGNALIIVAYTLTDGSGVRLAGDALSYIAWMFFLNAFPLLGLAAARRGWALFPLLGARWQRGLLGGGFAFSAYGIALWAMTQAPIALVAALRESAVIFGVVLAALVLKERFGPTRYTAAILVCIGAAVLKFA